MRRRTFLGMSGALGAAGFASGAWAFVWEPAVRIGVVRHRVAPVGWPSDLAMTIACLADPHVAAPHTPPERLARIVGATNALQPDMVVLLGDYLASHRFISSRPGMAEVAGILAGLRAPLGVHAILGNHDWWEDAEAQRGHAALPQAATDFAAAGLPVLHNAARRLEHRGRPFWVAGLGSQWAFRGREVHRGADDMAATLAALGDGAPAILLAHEPDAFPHVPRRFALTLSGHTHGGQVRLGGWSPVVPSRYGNRYAWGHVAEEGRHLVVSGGIGHSILPVRLGVPPEITLVELAAA